ncbi:hypothetical protein [Streptomyces sp. NBC_00063]
MAALGFFFIASPRLAIAAFTGFAAFTGSPPAGPSATGRSTSWPPRS